MKTLNKPKPKVYKLIDGCPTEQSRLRSNPDLVNNLFHTKEGDSFELSPSITLFPIETPGHLSDHLCFLMKERQGKTKFFRYSIFTGDHIIGAKSTFFMDYPAYFESLLKTKDVIEKFKVKTLYGAHSVSLYPKDVALDAK